MIAGKMTRTGKNNERGMALLLTLFALLLLSAIGLAMVLSSNTETRIDANYASGIKAYNAASSGLEEIRDRIKHPAATGGLSDVLPGDIAGNPSGVMYVVNSIPGETIDPTDPSSPYFDDEFCHLYNSGTARGVKCAAGATAAQMLPNQASLPPATGPLGYAWVRVNLKTNRIADPYFVDQTGTSAPVDTRVCWDGKAEQLSPSAGNPSCDANGMQTIYMLTALALNSRGSGPNGARKLLRAEVVAPSIRPAGALTTASMNLTTPSAPGIPPVAIDGRVHKLDGTLAPASSCSAISPLATNTGSSQMEQALNQIRKSIVDLANASCNADGSPIGSNSCTAGLWWVRGTDSATRFVTSLTSGGTSGTSSSGGSGSGDGGDGGHDGHDGHHSDPTGITSGACDPSMASCYTNLDLAAPELFAASAISAPHVPAVTLPPNPTAPFVGADGNQADATIYQPSGTQIVANQIALVNNLVSVSQNSPGFFTASSLTLNGSYGSSNSPAVVAFTDSTLTVPATGLSGYGILVVPNALEIPDGSRLSWTGIVLVNSGTGHVTVGQAATGSINGALLMAPGAVFNFPGTTSGGTSAMPPFQITYSCEAIDLSFRALPFKIVSKAETSF